MVKRINFYFFCLASVAFLNMFIVHYTLSIEPVKSIAEVHRVFPIYKEDINVEEEVFGVDYESEFIPGFYQYESPVNELVPLADDEQRKIQDIAEKYDIDVNLVYGICSRESGFNREAYNSGCAGIMQISTKYHKMDDPFDIFDNIEAGCKYLRALYDKYGNTETVLAVYHGEKDALTKTTPSSYVRDVMERRNKYAESR